MFKRDGLTFKSFLYTFHYQQIKLWHKPSPLLQSLRSVTTGVSLSSLSQFWHTHLRFSAELKLQQAGKGVGAQYNTKALWKWPDHDQLLPRLLSNQTLLFNCWMFEGIQLVQLFPYHRCSERHQCIVGYNTPETISEQWFPLLFDHQSQ